MAEIIPEYVDENEIVVIAPTNDGDCKLKRDSKSDKNKKKPGDSALANDIREITQSILTENDCDVLQLKLKTATNALKDDLDDKLGITKNKLSEILPITKIPTNPLKIPSWLKKFTIGRILPDLDSIVDLIKKVTEVTSAISDLINVIDNINPKLDACNIVGQIEREFEDLIKNEINQTKSQIARVIAEAICEGLNALDITADDLERLKQTKSALNDLSDSFEELKRTTDEALGESISRISQNQTVIQELTGIPPVLDTSSLDSFVKSVDSPEYQQYKESVFSILDTPEPIVDTLPILTGNTVVGSELACSNGVWEANGVSLSYSHQWFRNGAEIYGANTFNYTVSVDDIESRLFCEVTAQTNVTTEFARSAETDIITFALESGDKPTITGSATVGSTLTCSTGTWPFTPTTIQYEWIRGTSTVVQVLSGNNLYKVVSADVGSTLKCKVVAQSFKYTVSDTTNSTSTVS